MIQVNAPYISGIDTQGGNKQSSEESQDFNLEDQMQASKNKQL